MRELTLTTPARLSLLIAFSLACASSAATGAGTSGCTTKFEDRFTNGTLDSSEWTTQDRPGNGQGTARAQLEYLAPSAIHTGSGGLKITATESNGTPKSGLPYIGGQIETVRSFLYGHFEFVARMPAGRGLWPALWLRTPLGKPFDGEIDLTEGYGSHPDRIQSTLHPWHNGVEPRFYCAIVDLGHGFASSTGPCENRSSEVPSSSAGLADTFHTYAVDWQPNSITWSLDGTPYYTLTQDIPNEPMIIVIDLALSAAHDGQPDESLRLPQSLDVSRVSVCQ